MFITNINHQIQYKKHKNKMYKTKLNVFKDVYMNLHRVSFSKCNNETKFTQFLVLQIQSLQIESSNVLAKLFNKLQSCANGEFSLLNPLQLWSHQACRFLLQMDYPLDENLPLARMALPIKCNCNFMMLPRYLAASLHRCIAAAALLHI